MLSKRCTKTILIIHPKLGYQENNTNDFLSLIPGAGNNVETSQQMSLQQSQPLAHQKSLNQETMQQSFIISQLNASQATTPLQHPTSTSLRLNPVVTVQKPFLNFSNILRQSTGTVFIKAHLHDTIIVYDSHILTYGNEW